MKCRYCEKEADLVGGDVIYPHRPDLREKKFYLCAPCNAYVGCHKGTDKAMGRLANAELRKAKMAAHAHFDPIWKTDETTTRRQAYKWLAEQLEIPTKQCHIGYFDLDMCNKVVQVCNA